MKERIKKALLVADNMPDELGVDGVFCLAETRRMWRNPSTKREGIVSLCCAMRCYAVLWLLRALLVADLDREEVRTIRI